MKLNAFTVAAVVVTYNRKDLLRECLNALRSQTRSLDEIIVIDNASTDGTNKMISLEFPWISYVRLPENIGGAGGFHEGMKLAYEKAHDWIWIMDDDAKPDPDALAQLLQHHLLQDISIYAITSAVLNTDRSINISNRRVLHSFRHNARPVDRRTYKEREHFQIDLATFVGVLVAHHTITKIGLPMKDLFIYSDDFEYSLRIRRHGGKIINVSKSKIEHVSAQVRHKRALTAPLSWRSYYMRRNLLYTYRKYNLFGITSYIRLFFTVAKSQIVILLLRRQKFHSTKILWSAIIHGLKGRLGKTIRP